MHPDLEFLRLEEALRQARERLAWIRRFVPDRAAIKAAEDLCAEATAAVGVYRMRQAQSPAPIGPLSSQHAVAPATPTVAGSDVHEPLPPELLPVSRRQHTGR